ncbi:MAG TPA: M20/M25/M40 family metallo-hydrolase [Nitrospirales bacterium]|nr:M20/M25/M40 family metallo-hydrolase [Nitrospirales bacterium]
MRGVLLLVLLTLTLIPSDPLTGEPPIQNRLDAQVSQDRLMETVRDLSRFHGRQSGTPGGEAAAAYLQRRLPQASLQSFPLRALQIRSPVKVSLTTGGHTKGLQNTSDFIPILNGATAHLASVPVAFAGYGIADSALGLDEYAGVSVSGKVVLFLRGQPKGYTGRGTHREKVRIARAKGAVAYLTVTGPLLTPYEQRRGMSQRPMAFYGEDPAEALPGLWVAPSVADALLEPIGLTLESFQKDMDRALSPRSVETGSVMALEMAQRQSNADAANVLGLWPGSDPDLRHETIILGAHYDHFGVQDGTVFPGADDNASGSAVLLEVARVLAAAEAKPKRSILFLALAAEEQGLLGSRFYVAHPARPLSATKAMINVDHAGVGTGKLTVGLSRLEKATAQAAADTVGLGGQLELFGFFPGGDHVPFAEAAIPTAAIVSSGPHPDFHHPTDTPEKISPDILASATRLTLSLVWALANAEL